MRLLFTISAMLIVAAAASCGGNAAAPPVAARGTLATPVMAQLGGKMASGVPEGIYVTWTRNSEPEAAGYYLYRDVNPIPTPPPDETISPALRVNGGNPVAQPPSGPNVTFSDLFTVTVGATYYYRVTVLDTQGIESYPSNEMSWTVLGQTVTGLDPTSAFWGDDITLTGTTFGAYDPVTDHVLFQTVESNTVEGAVVGWTDTEIVATVPDDTITGPVYVVIDATIAATDDDLQILNPFLTTINPEVGFVEQLLTLNGENLGAAPGEVWIGTTEVTSFVQSWSSTQIDLLPPDGIVEAPVTVVAGGLTSNGITFKPRAEILSIDVYDTPVDNQGAPQAPVTITGRYFGGTNGTVQLDADPQQLSVWIDELVGFAVKVGQAPGDYTLTVTTPDGVTSNGVPFEVLEPFDITISGVAATLYTPADSPVLTLNYPDDIERLEIYAGPVLVYSSSTLSHSFPLPMNSIPNGDQQLLALAFGRGVMEISNTLLASFYTLPGDINGDGLVDLIDTFLLPNYIGLRSSNPAYRVWYDTDGDGEVTEADASLIGYAYGNLNVAPTL